MRPKPIRMFSRAAMLLLVMLLTTATAWAWDGSGTSADPYLITSTDDLNQLATNVNNGTDYKNVYFKQAADIAYSTEGVGDTESNFTAIGNQSHYFRGHYDGQGHTISGIRIYKGGKNDADDYQGLFGKISQYADVRGITLADTRITGFYNIGGIVGYNSWGTVTDCHVKADVFIHAVKSTAYYHGGIVGVNDRGTVTDCTSAATLTKSDDNEGMYYGGIAGMNYTGTLRNNVAIGVVVPAAQDNTYGAICGQNNSGTLQNNCYYACTVAGVENATGVGCYNADVDGANTASPNHFEQTGTNEYTIKTAGGWNLFCALLATEAKGYFTGKTVKLAYDISVTRMAGASYHDFTGTFDGNQKTLTFNYTTSAENAAPFQYVENATIKNLHVAGTIQTSNKFAAGFIAHQYGTVTIQNCRSSVVINSSINGDGTHGGFVAENQKNASLTIDGCVFDGKLLTTNGTTKCGGFVGWKNNNGTVDVTNSLYTPAALESGETECTSGSYTFVRNGEAGTNCHFTRTLGTAQGGGMPTFLTRGDGAGTSANPYKITNANDLKDLAVYVNGTGTYSNGFSETTAHNCSEVYFQQTNPITLTSAWTPIGTTSANPFKGHYDGGNFTISGLTVSGNYQYAGLFGFISSDYYHGSQIPTELKNINIVDCNIDVSSAGQGNGKAAGIASYVACFNMSNCKVSGTIKGYGYAAGLIGQAGSFCTMNGCFADVTVSAHKADPNAQYPPAYCLIGQYSNNMSASGNYYHDNGGNVSANYNSVIKNSATPLYMVTGAPSGVTVAATNATLTHGGKHFFASGATATLTIDDASKAFSTFSVSGATYSLAADRKNATVTLASSDATVSATLITITGSCGTNATWTMSDADGNGTFETLTINGTGAITSSPWATDFAATIERVNIGSADLTISGNPFSTLGEGALIVVPTTAYAVSYSSAAYASKLRVALGSYLFTATNEGGTAAYEIANETDLRNLSAAVNQNHQGCNGLTFCQTAPITLNGTFTPIGYFNDSSDKQDFYGTYDGGGYTISGLSVSSTQVYTGLFGVVRNGGMVKNVRLISPSVTCNFYESRVGALIGLADQCTIENCSVVSPIVSATASSQYNKVGALVGNLSAANVQNCFVVSPTVSAAGSTKVGAICGYAYSASTNSYCTLTNVYYYNSSLEAIGQHDNSQISKVTNVARARKVTAGDGVTVSPAASDPANGFVYNNESYYREGLELTLGNTLGEAPEYYALNYATTAGTINGSTLTVGNADATVSAAIRSDGQPHSITYMKADGTTDQADAIALDGYETAIKDYSTYNVHLAAGTYYVGHDISYDYKIVPDGDITLILGNGKTMTLASNVTGIQEGTIYLTIYGQSLDPATAGTLRYDGTSSKGIYVGDYTQHSGNVSLICSDYNGVALEASTVTLNGGKLTITANSTNAKAIKASMTVTITGGQLDATATGTNAVGILTSSPSYGDITLGWTNADDYIHVSSYKVNQSGTVKIADGQSIYNGSEVLSGTITDMSKLNGKTLRPYKTITLADAADNSSTIREWNGSVAEVTLQGRTLTKDGNWNTLCLPFSLTEEQIAASPLAGATIKTMDNTAGGTRLDRGSGTLTLKFNTVDAIEAGKPYIIKWDGDGTNNIVNPTFSGVTISSTTPTAVKSWDWNVTFVGQYSPFSIVSSGATGDNEGNKNEILLMTKGNKIGYSKNPRTLNCFRCHFYVPTSSGEYFARNIEVDFGEGEATALSEELRVKSEDVYYTLDGRKLEGKPTAKGMYIVNGRKVIIK